jgi:hypothetical protein
MASANARIAIRLKTRAQLRRDGHSRHDINWMMDAADDELIDTIVAKSGEADALAATEAAAAPIAPAAPADAAAATPDIGGGAGGTTGTGVFMTIVQALIKFLESPQGQALIAALIKFLLGALAHAICLCHIPADVLKRFMAEAANAAPANHGAGGT